MIHWGVETLEEAFHLGERAAGEVTKYLRSVMQTEQASIAGREQRDVKGMTEIVKLEHEKEYWPYLLLKKKNYAGRKWTPKSYDPLVLKDEIDKKGIQAVRRDTVPFVADISNAIIDALLLKNSAAEAIAAVRDGLDKVAREQVPMDKYITSKSIASSYAGNAIPHVLAWQRMRDRGDDDLPPIGGRMPFVIVAGDTALAQRAEHPLHVAKIKKKLDTEYYIKAAINPLKKLLQFCDDGTVDEIFAEALNVSKSRTTATLDSFCVESTGKPAKEVVTALSSLAAAVAPVSKKRKTETAAFSLDSFL